MGFPGVGINRSGWIAMSATASMSRHLGTRKYSIEIGEALCLARRLSCKHAINAYPHPRRRVRRRLIVFVRCEADSAREVFQLGEAGRARDKEAELANKISLPATIMAVSNRTRPSSIALR